MKKYRCIKRFANCGMGEEYIETDKIHPRWGKKVYILLGTEIEDNQFLLENHVKNKKYFEEIK